MKRPHEGKGADDKARGAKRGVSMPCVLKFLTPEVLASVVIGKGGASISQLRQSAQAKIGLSDHSELYPGTDCRVLTAQANTEESLTEVSRQIIAKVADCAQTAPLDSVGTPGELKLRALVPRAAVGGLIGKGGAAIKQLRETSNAKISISEPVGSGPAAEQMVTLTGSQEALEYVMGEVNRQVQALNGETWFQSWASATCPPAGGGGGGGGLGGGTGYGLQDGRYGYDAPDVRHGQFGGKGNGGFGGKGNGRLDFGHGMGEAPGMDTMMRVARCLPPYVMEDQRGFALSCVVPNRLVGGLIGRAGSGTKEIQSLTQTKIGIREIPGDPDNRSLNIAGPLASTCAAYMLMMQRYLDAEAQASQEGPLVGKGDSGGGGGKGGRR